MLNCPFNSNPDFVWSWLILFSPILHIYVKFSPQHDPSQSTMTPPWIFYWTKVHFMGPLITPILGSPWVSEPGWFPHLHSYLLTASLPALYVANGSSESTLMRLGPNHEPHTCWVGMSNVSNVLAMPTCFAWIIHMIFLHISCVN